jgi:ubiquinone/menaquinone biosynthesis C-methylase UbiE
VLEVGISAGTDFLNWVRQGAIATGIDLTEQGVALTRERLSLEGLAAQVQVADAENLPFSDDTFDLVYSYGVLHRPPNTARAIHEVHRILRRGGVAQVMIYHSSSWTGLMLRLVLCCEGQAVANPQVGHVSPPRDPGDQELRMARGAELFSVFSSVSVCTQLSRGDLP